MTSDEYFCCKNDYKINPIDLKCSLSEINNSICYIKEWASYYTYNDENERKEFDICESCFKMKGTAIILPLSSPTPIPKTWFNLSQNNKFIDEVSIECYHCNRKFHAACVKQIDTREDRFICNLCRTNNRLSKKPKLISSSIIPPTDLSEKIEKMVSKIIHNHTNKRLKNDINLRVNIRVVADGELNFKLDPPLVKYILQNSDDTLTYRGKTILAFQMIDGVETLFFALYVHEFGDDTIPQNRRRVYIAYLDSVNYFEPKEIRSDVYKEIILGYLANARQRGFIHAHIWSCPPDEGKEYIFFRHPSNQKVPSQERLINWYKSMLDNGVQRDIIIKHQNLHSYLIENNMKHYTEIPLFDGDYWPLALVDVFRLPPNKRTSATVLQSIKRFHDTFFVVTLHDREMEQSIKSFKILHDSRCTFRCTDIVNRRDTFIYFCRDALMEFSSLRRAQLATIKLLTELKRENLFASYTCDNCRCQLLSERFSCPVCVEFDLCRKCYESGLHSEHQMQEILEKTHDIYMYDVMEWFNHSLRCKQCTNNRCLIIKSLIIHAGSCKMKLERCKACHQFINILQTHIHTCQNSKCVLLHCQKKKEEDRRHQAYIAMVRAYENKKRYERARGNLEGSTGFTIPDTLLFDETRIFDYIMYYIKYNNLSEDEFFDWCSKEERLTAETMFRLQTNVHFASNDMYQGTSPSSVSSEDSRGSLKRRTPPSHSEVSSPSTFKRMSPNVYSTPSPIMYNDNNLEDQDKSNIISYNKLTASQLINKSPIQSNASVDNVQESKIQMTASQLIQLNSATQNKPSSYKINNPDAAPNQAQDLPSPLQSPVHNFKPLVSNSTNMSYTAPSENAQCLPKAVFISQRVFGNRTTPNQTASNSRSSILKNRQSSIVNRVVVTNNISDQTVQNQMPVTQPSLVNVNHISRSYPQPNTITPSGLTQSIQQPILSGTRQSLVNILNRATPYRHYTPSNNQQTVGMVRQIYIPQNQQIRANYTRTNHQPLN